MKKTLNGAYVISKDEYKEIKKLLDSIKLEAMVGKNLINTDEMGIKEPGYYSLNLIESSVDNIKSIFI